MPEAKPKKPEPSWDESIRTLVYALLLALVFRSFLFEPFHIPSGSMKDTLLVGDYLFVSKYSYGYSRYSFPLGLPLFKGRVMESIPKRGDVVVFRPPKLPHVDYIKRVIGLPGDRVQMREGQLYLNDRKVLALPAGDYVDEPDGEEGRSREAITSQRFVESLPDGPDHDILDRGLLDGGNGLPDRTGVYTVPEGHYFVMGDNRDNSIDSRFTETGVGFVPAENLVGKAQFILFSLGDDTPFWQLWRWPTSIRWDRFFHTIP